MHFYSHIYDCCVGLKKKSKLHAAMGAVEELTDEGPRKLAGYCSGNKRCLTFSVSCRMKGLALALVL